jgi:hypothetical protein
MVMETADFAELDYLAFGRGLCFPELRGIFSQRQMSTPAVVIGSVRSKSTPERALSEDDDVIQTLAANGVRPGK